MRVATLILGLFLTIGVTLESCVAQVGGQLTAGEKLQEGGAVGLLVALLALIGCAFAIGAPWVSFVMLALAGGFGVAAASTTPFADLYFWGGGAWLLALLSLVSAVQRHKDPTPVSGPPLGGFCPQCGATLPNGSTFCNRCGATVGPVPPPTPIAAQAPAKRNFGATRKVGVGCLAVLGVVTVIVLAKSVTITAQPSIATVGPAMPTLPVIEARPTAEAEGRWTHSAPALPTPLPTPTGPGAFDKNLAQHVVESDMFGPGAASSEGKIVVINGSLYEPSGTRSTNPRNFMLFYPTGGHTFEVNLKGQGPAPVQDRMYRLYGILHVGTSFTATNPQNTYLKVYLDAYEWEDCTTVPGYCR